MVVTIISTVLVTIVRYLGTQDRPKFSMPSLGDNPMAKFVAAAKRFVREEEGATLVEYALAIAPSRSSPAPGPSSWEVTSVISSPESARRSVVLIFPAL